MLPHGEERFRFRSPHGRREGDIVAIIRLGMPTYLWKVTYVPEETILYVRRLGYFSVLACRLWGQWYELLDAERNAV